LEILQSIKYSSHGNENVFNLPDGKTQAFSKKYGTFLFVAYGCALFERRTPQGQHVYTAANLTTGKTAIISFRKKKLQEISHEEMKAKIAASEISGENLFFAERLPEEVQRREPRKEKPPKLNISKTMHHIFKDILPQHGYSLRERQVELAEHILDVIERKGVTLAESEVGTGKTHAYLIARLLAKRGRVNDGWLRGIYPKQNWADSAHMPVVISTSSIALQQAIVSDYIPELSNILIQHGIISARTRRRKNY
jgi:ATP-dependent DNA helicase DinG